MTFTINIEHTMPWKYLEEEAIADIAIEVTTNTLDELFQDACYSICHLMTDLKLFEAIDTREFSFSNKGLDLLLYQVLEELLFLKDAELFFVKEVSCKIIQEKEESFAQVSFIGGKFNRTKHKTGNDIKSITFSNFFVQKENRRWRAHFIVDV